MGKDTPVQFAGTGDRLRQTSCWRFAGREPKCLSAQLLGLPAGSSGRDSALKHGYEDFTIESAPMKTELLMI